MDAFNINCNFSFGLDTKKLKLKSDQKLIIQKSVCMIPTLLKKNMLNYLYSFFQVRAGSAAVCHAEGAGEKHRLQPDVGAEGAGSTVHRG